MSSHLYDRGEMKGGKNKTGIIILVIIIVLLMVAVGFLVFSQQSKQEEKEKRSKVITEDNIDEIFDEIANDQNQEAAPEYYTVTMNYDWYFDNGEAESSNAYVENNTQNTTDVYFDIFLSDDSENPIYKSPIIPVGGSLDKIKLDRVLDAGTYDCTCVYHLVDEEQNTLTTVTITLNIVIKE